MNLRSSGATDPGPVRAENDDRFVADDAAGLYAAIDGTMGWEDSLIGGAAAERAIEALREGMRRLPRLGDDSPGGRLMEAFELIGNRVRELRNEQTPGDTTVAIVAMSVDHDRAFLVHVGHCRAYLWRDHRLDRLTIDHSYAEEYRRRYGTDPRPDSAVSKIQLRHLGAKPPGNEEPDASLARLIEGDRILLCTPGLWRSVSDDEIASALRESPTPQAATLTLVRRANAGPERDNVTVVVVDVEK